MAGRRGRVGARATRGGPRGPVAIENGSSVLFFVCLCLSFLFSRSFFCVVYPQGRRKPKARGKQKRKLFLWGGGEKKKKKRESELMKRRERERIKRGAECEKRRGHSREKERKEGERERERVGSLNRSSYPTSNSLLLHPEHALEHLAHLVAAVDVGEGVLAEAVAQAQGDDAVCVLLLLSCFVVVVELFCGCF